MKKKEWIAVLLIGLTAFTLEQPSVTVTLPTQMETKQTRTERNLNNMHIVYESFYFEDGKVVREKQEAFFNDRGHYCMNMLEGKDKWSFWIWDGQDYYYYNSFTKEMIVQDLSQDVIYPWFHPQMSEGELSQRVAMINNGQLRKTREFTMFGLEAAEYESAETEIEVSPYDRQLNPHLYKETGNTRRLRIVLDKGNKFVLESTTYINGKFFSKRGFTQMEFLPFPSSCLVPNPPADARIKRLPW